MPKREARHLTHGMSKTRIYKIWVDMKRRCKDKTRKGYEHYGGKGISYCSEWERFEPFYEWSIKNGYDDTLTIDRIDGAGNYEPSNCRWVNQKTQANNPSRNNRVPYLGKTQTLAEWSEEYNIPYNILQDRVNDLGWDFEKALKTPIGSSFKNKKLLELNGKKMSISDWSRELGISTRTISDRLKMGLPIEQVLSKEHIKKGKFITYKDETHNIKEWSEITGIFEGVLAYRVRQNWDIEDIFNTPVGAINNYKTTKQIERS